VVVTVTVVGVGVGGFGRDDVALGRCNVVCVGNFFTQDYGL
jgi:hypothetical protein